MRPIRIAAVKRRSRTYPLRGQQVATTQDTRERLLDAAQRLFAAGGAWTTPLAQVVRAAGQRNESAIQYHFGSREELIFELLERGREREMRARHTELDRLERADLEPSLHDAVVALARPSCAGLRTQAGRQTRLIIADVVRGISDEQLVEARPSDLLRTLGHLERAMPSLDRKVRRARVAAALRLLTEMTAARARTIEAGRRPALGAGAFEHELVAVLEGLLSAPGPGLR